MKYFYRYILFTIRFMPIFSVGLLASLPVLAQQAEIDCNSPSDTATKKPSLLIRRCFSEYQLLQLKSAIIQLKSDLSREERQTAEDLARLFGIQRGALNYLYGIVSEQDIEPEELADRFAEKLKLHWALIEQVKARISDEPSSKSWRTCLSKVENGQYAEASNLVVSLRDEQLLYDGQQAENKRDGAQRLAAMQAILGQIALIQSRFPEAVQHFQTASELVAAENETGRNYREAAADTLHIQSKEDWNGQGLQQAIEIYQKLLQETSREKEADLWAAIQNKLGDALLRLGVGQRSVPALKDAVGAFKAVLDVQTKERDPKLWANAQANLAAALFRRGVQEKDTESLLNSVAAYRFALSEIDSKTAPEDWVSRQNGLGAALWSLGTSDQGTSYLEAAVKAFTDALAGLNAERNPRDWGATQNNLGAALFALAERQPGETHLQQAIAAFKASLSAYQDASALYFVVGVKKNLTSAETMLRERQAKSRTRQ